MSKIQSFWVLVDVVMEVDHCKPTAQSLTSPNLPVHGFSFTYGVTSAQPQGFDWSSAFALQTVPFDFIPADSTAYADAFSSADFCQATPAATGGENLSYYEYSADYFGFWGGVDAASGAQLIHPEVLKYLPFPMGVGDVHTDSLDLTFEASGLTYFRSFEVHMEGLEFGTLTLPNGVFFQNTLRIEATTLTEDSSAAGSSALLTEGMQYWTQDMPLPVAQTYTYTQIVDGDSTVVFAGAEFVTEATQGVDLPIVKPLEAFPSPAANTLTVSSDAGTWIVVIDAQGRIVERRQLQTSQETWDVSAWPVGMHFLQAEGTPATKRILVTH